MSVDKSSKPKPWKHEKCIISVKFTDNTDGTISSEQWCINHNERIVSVPK